MKPSPTMQHLITQLAVKHRVDLSESGQYLRLALPDHSIHLIIETTDDHQVMVGCYDGYGTEDADPYLRFAPGYPTGWLPVELLYSPQEWAAFQQLAGCSIDPDAVELADLTEYWAKRLLEQGWLLQGEKRAEPHGRLPGCQSTNHTKCYGELWRCAACGKTVCCAEGTDNHPELCDDCWVIQVTPHQEVAQPTLIILRDQTLLLACDCPEHGGECDTWLELTNDGFLIVEDKDGLRVSMLLPEWLECAMRNVTLAHVAVNEDGATNDGGKASQTSVLDRDTRPGS